MTDSVLRDRFFVPEDPYEGRRRSYPHRLLKIVPDALLDLGIGKLDILRKAGSPHHAPEQHLPFRGAPLEDAGVPKSAERRKLFLFRDQIAETVQIVVDPLLFVAEADDRHRCIRYLP